MLYKKHHKMKLIIIASVIIITGIFTTSVESNSNINFKLAARNLSAMDPFGGAPDPYIIITYENPPNPPFILGETSKLSDTTDPDWPDVFNVIHTNGSTQHLTFDVYDEDIDADDYMGVVNITLYDIVTSFGGFLQRDIILDNSTFMGVMVLSANVTSSG